MRRNRKSSRRWVSGMGYDLKLPKAMLSDTLKAFSLSFFNLTCRHEDAMLLARCSKNSMRCDAMAKDILHSV